MKSIQIRRKKSQPQRFYNYFTVQLQRFIFNARSRFFVLLQPMPNVMQMTRVFENNDHCQHRHAWLTTVWRFFRSTTGATTPGVALSQASSHRKTSHSQLSTTAGAHQLRIDQWLSNELCNEKIQNLSLKQNHFMHLESQLTSCFE